MGVGWFVPEHFKAILYRRLIIVKRSWKRILLSVIATLVFSALAIVAQYLMKSLMPITFDTLLNKNKEIMVSVDSAMRTQAEPYIDSFKAMFKQDTGNEPNLWEFDSRADLNAWMYKNSEDHTGPEYVSLGLGIVDLMSAGSEKNDFIIYWNSSEYRADRVMATFLSR